MSCLEWFNCVHLFNMSCLEWFSCVHVFNMSCLDWSSCVHLYIVPCCSTLVLAVVLCSRWSRREMNWPSGSTRSRTRSRSWRSSWRTSSWDSTGQPRKLLKIKLPQSRWSRFSFFVSLLWGRWSRINYTTMLVSMINVTVVWSSSRFPFNLCCNVASVGHGRGVGQCWIVWVSCTGDDQRYVSGAESDSQYYAK